MLRANDLVSLLCKYENGAMHSMFLELVEIISNLYKSGLTCIVLLTTTKVAFDSIHLKRAYEACCKNRLFAVCLKRLL